MDDHFIITYTGKVFSFDNIEPENIDIWDIAHALSQLCRYTGHTNMFYSVAQHSLLVAEKIPGLADKKLAALLHDAAEAYVNDLASPIKAWMGLAHKPLDGYRFLHDEILEVVYKEFDVYPTQSDEDDVALYDQAACLFEAEGFLGLSESETEKYGFPVETRGLWQPWDPKGYASQNSDLEMGEVETRFLERFETLTRGRD